MMGVYDNNKFTLKLFWYYLFVRTGISLYTFAVDMVPLLKCEQTGIDLHTRMFYNEAMHRIKLAGDCQFTRNVYVFCWMLDFYLCAYSIYVLGLYLEQIRENEEKDYLERMRLAAQGKEPELKKPGQSAEEAPSDDAPTQDYR